MKIVLYLSVIIAIVSGCKTNKSVGIELPELMADSLKKVTKVQCETGLALYRENCSRCHTDTVKGREVIPDFSSDQLSNYEFRFANRKHEEQLSEAKLTQDELVLIITFLSYKKKNK